MPKMRQVMQDIQGSEDWETIREITGNWSNDRKFFIQKKDGEKLLLRLADSFLYEEKKKEYARVQRWNTLPFPMSQALAFGLCAQGSFSYTLLSWVEGESLDKLLPGMTKQEQYQLGVQAGKILKAIHGLPVDPVDLPKQDPQSLMLQRLSRYEQSDVRVKGDEPVIAYVKENLDKTRVGLPPVYQHGDFKVSNLVLTPEKELGIIGFHRQGCGDRYQEFDQLEAFDVEVSILFSLGQIHGYFDGDPDDSFWDALSVYSAYASLVSINWAKKFGDDEVARMQHRFAVTYEDHKAYANRIPKWYVPIAFV